MSSRSAARLIAVQTLYQVDLAGAEPGPALEDLIERTGAPEEVEAFARGLVEVAVARRDELDALIAEHLSDSWTLRRLGRIEHAILRLASAELVRDGEVPTAVILDEACELARDFLDEKGVRFLNGVLDPLARTVRPDGQPVAG